MGLSPPQAPPGWYWDPTERHQRRYWSGTTWTDHAADEYEMVEDRLVVVPLAAANVEPDWIARGESSQWPYPRKVKVRGVLPHQDVFIERLGLPDGEDSQFEPVEVDLVREFDNETDWCACLAVIGGKTAGYLPREIAKVLAPIADGAEIRSWRVAGAIVGGCRGAENYGLRLWLDRRLTRGPEWPTTGSAAVND